MESLVVTITEFLSISTILYLNCTKYFRCILQRVIQNSQSPQVNGHRLPMNHAHGASLAQQQANIAMQHAKSQNAVNQNVMNMRNIQGQLPGSQVR